MVRDLWHYRAAPQQRNARFPPIADHPSTQALNTFAIMAGGSINKMKALKPVYFADRYHLRRYGRPIIGDEYLAMNYGPVPSGTKDLAEMSEFLGEEEASYGRAFLRPLDRYMFGSEQPVEERVFSASDREALEWAWRRFGDQEEFTLAALTHRDPEWKRHEEQLAAKLVSRAAMNYRDFLDDPPPDVEPCHPLSPEQRAAIAEGISELAAFQRLWQ
jgi:uncharacterized phage-associated protein